MQALLPLLLILLALSGCAKEEASAAMDLAPSGKTASFLAYEHSLALETGEEQLAPVVAAAQAVCREAAEELCTLLESHVRSGRSASASLKFRAKPEGIRKIVAVLAGQTQVTDQSTTAEDLEAPIADTARKLAMLKEYRTRLETLGGRASHDVDALIKVNRELAEVQSQLEALEGKHAQLRQRVETEILRVHISTDAHGAFWKPIGLALSDFGRNLSQGASFAITSIAFLIPWLLLLILLGWGARRLWRRRKEAGSGGAATG